MTLLLYTRRVSATLGATASTRTLAAARPHAAALARLGASVDATLADLADAVRSGRAPAPLPAMEELADGIDSALIAPRVMRLAQQLTVLREAVQRVRQ